MTEPLKWEPIIHNGMVIGARTRFQIPPGEDWGSISVRTFAEPLTLAEWEVKNKESSGGVWVSQSPDPGPRDRG